MSTFIPSPGIVFTEIKTVQNLAQAASLAAGTQGQQWRPPGWSSGSSQLTMITVPVSSQADPNEGLDEGEDGASLDISYTNLPTDEDDSSDEDDGGDDDSEDESDDSDSSGQQASPTVYVFDAVFRIGHGQRITRTSHPVQTGANISDHAYLNPATVQLEIGMSDAMASYDASTWTGDSSKSVNAYQTLLALAKQRVLVTVTTRLNTYENMMIEGIETSDSHETAASLKATITLSEFLLAGVTATSSTLSFRSDDDPDPDSARPQTTDSTTLGTTQTSTPAASLLNQHVIPSTLYSSVMPYSQSIPGVGPVSSNSLGQLLG